MAFPEFRTLLKIEIRRARPAAGARRAGTKGGAPSADRYLRSGTQWTRNPVHRGLYGKYQKRH